MPFDLAMFLFLAALVLVGVLAASLSDVYRQRWIGKLNIARQGDFGADPKPTKKPTSTRKYECPECGLSVRATKDVDIICAECSCHLEKVS